MKLYCERFIMTGCPPERSHSNAAANSILRAIGQRPVSRPWLSRWLKANKHFLRPRRSKPLAAERKAVHEQEETHNYFRRFEKAIREYNIKKENCWNCNKTGWRIGCLGGRLVSIFPETSAVYMLDPNTRESVTSMEYISVVGGVIPSMLILSGITLSEGNFDNDIGDDVVFANNTESGSGYSNDQLAIDWLEHFEKHTRPGVKII